MLVCGPNLSIDQTVSVPRLTVGTIHRVPTILKLAGGKGTNVARALRILGGEPLLLGFAGGPAGEQLRAYLRQDGIAHTLVPIAGETRACFTIADETTGEQTEFYEAGPAVSAVEVSALLAALEASVAGQQWVVVTGSLPRDAPPDLYARCVDLAHRGGARVVLDARGAALAAGVAAGPDVVKINAVELSGYAGRPLETVTDIARAAAALPVAGAGAGGGGAIITLGQAGAVVTHAGACWHVAPPSVAAISPVGSGDAAAAGVVLALERGANVLEAARLGVAAGTANALHLGAAHFSRSEVERMLAECATSPVT
jgi:1-phosphofructokinase family hexose kinase